MQSPLKILVIEKNCAQLIALTVWLTQFSDLQITGSLSRQGLRQSINSPTALEYDVIVYGLEINNNEEIPLELAMDLSLIREIKSKIIRPTIILLTNNITNTQTNSVVGQIMSQLFKECDGHLSSNHALKKLHAEIVRLTTCKQLGTSGRLIARAG